MSEFFAPLQSVDVPELLLPLRVLRLDQIPPMYSGNKYFKLKYTIQQAKNKGFTCLLSFGGAYSNHIHALALAGKQQGLETIGIIRGERTTPLNPTLSDAEQAGMVLHFVSRQEYRLRYNSEYLNQLAAQYKGSFILSEGGSNLSAVRGCMEIVEHIHHGVDHNYDVIILPCATAATLAGVIAAAPQGKQVIGVSVLKNVSSLESQVMQYHKALGVKDNKHWHIEHGYHCGGYAKINKELINFVTDFQQRNNIPLEPIYSGKMFYALYQLLNNNTISTNSRVIAIHTGGLQGLRGMKASIDRLRSGTKVD
ncbi:pyridoxal-phosphate dependent enzyme [bacterium AH-315-K03]|nr:pyridoxal-phosphate dependent enzyme [bacterium AH-315-K03]